MHSHSSLRSVGAFTLLELIVVIGIIAMLATLLFPVTGKIMDSLHETKCANNLRQLGMIIQTAAMDNNGNYVAIENDPQNPIHNAEDGKVLTLPELAQARGASIDIVKCPADLSAKLYHPKDGSKQTSYFEGKGSSYEWYPYYEGENMNAPRRMGWGDTFRTVPPNRVRLLMDYAESGEAPHNRSPQSSSMHTLYADGSVRTVVLTKEQ